MSKPRYTFWDADEYYYGRVKEFPTPELFLAHIYANGSFFEGWKEEHPLDTFIAAEVQKVKRGWFRYSFMEGGDLYLDIGKAGQRGSFELWEWQK